MGITVKSTFLLFAALTGAVVACAQQPSDNFYRAIRNNDLAALKELLKTADPNVKDDHGTTPLMYTAAVGSLDAMKMVLAAGGDAKAKNDFDATSLLWCTQDIAKMRLLLSKGADVNARSKLGRNAVLIAASEPDTLPIVKMLIEKGADLSVKDSFQSTALLLATSADNTAVATLLIEKGADINAKDVLGTTALMNTAGFGNVALTRLLLAKGADVNATGEFGVEKVKNGNIELGPYTALLSAVPWAGVETVKLLLDAGAKIDATDYRGMTSLMLAIATDRPDPATVRLLLEKGADPNTKSKSGETARDWARKFGDPRILPALKMESAQRHAPAILTGDEKLPTARAAVEKSVPLLQRSSAGFFKEGGCVSCHAQNLTGLAIMAARAKQIKVDEKLAAEELRGVKLQWNAFQQPLLQRMAVPGDVDPLVYSIIDMAARGVAADPVIDAMVHNIAAGQSSGGNWHQIMTARPPIEDGDFSRTALSLRALSVYGPVGRKAEFDNRIQRAAAWLAASEPLSTEDRVMQLLGLKWANTDRAKLEGRRKELLALQRADGGWAQTPALESDAYATGQTLYLLHDFGMPATDAAYRRGVAYLLHTQLPDGSWHVSSRAPKFQPYFQSGFPHDHDQWISGSATAWSTMALSYAIADKPLTAAIH